MTSVAAHPEPIGTRTCARWLLTRENVLQQATSLYDLRLGMLLPGITINTGPADYAPLKQMQMMRFTGEHWKLFGPIMKGALAGG